MTKYLILADVDVLDLHIQMKTGLYSWLITLKQQHIFYLKCSTELKTRVSATQPSKSHLKSVYTHYAGSILTLKHSIPCSLHQHPLVSQARKRESRVPSLTQSTYPADGSSTPAPCWRWRERVRWGLPRVPKETCSMGVSGVPCCLRYRRR